MSLIDDYLCEGAGAAEEDALIAALEDSDVTERTRLCRDLLDALERADHRTGWQLLQFLQAFWPDEESTGARPFAATWAYFERHEGTVVREVEAGNDYPIQHAATFLSRVGRGAEEKVAELQSALSAQGLAIRLVAYSAAGLLGAAARGLLPRFAEALGDRQVAVRRVAAQALAKTARLDPAFAFPVLVELSEAADPELRRCAAQGLTGLLSARRSSERHRGAKGPQLELDDAVIALALGRLFRSGSPPVRAECVAGVVLLRATTPEVTAALGELLGDEHEAIRSSAAEACVRLGVHTDRAAAVLAASSAPP